MILVLAAGIWGILLFGASLQGQEDLSGEWTLRPLLFGGERRLTVSQSGRFVNVRTDAGRVINLRIQKSEVISKSGAGKVRIRMSGEKCDAEIEGISGSDTFRFRLKGFGYDGNWSAERTVRRYPGSKKTQPVLKVIEPKQAGTGALPGASTLPGAVASDDNVSPRGLPRASDARIDKPNTASAGQAPRLDNTTKVPPQTLPAQEDVQGDIR